MIQSKLSFRKDGTFVIAQFTDLHLSVGNEPDLKTTALLDHILDAEKPDLAVLTGDVIAGSGNEVEMDSAFAWSLAVRPMEERGIAWAAAFGNHDDEGPLSRSQLMTIQQGFAHCLTQTGPESLPGLGNYVLDLASSQGQGGPASRLYFFDSLSYGPEGVSRYAWISEEQIEWFRKRAAEAQGGPGLAFFHIPLPEYNDVWNLGFCKGSKFEEVCCPQHNSGLFRAMVESKAVRGVFVGHDHINDYEGELEGLRLCYGRAGGYNSYGKEGFPRGARLIRLREGEKDFETWIRLAENG